MKIKMTWAVMTLVLMGFVTLSVAEARPFGPHWKDSHMRRGFDGLKAFHQLDLTDTQRTQIKDIIAQYRDDTASLRSDIRKQRLDLTNLLQSESLNEEEARMAFRKNSALKEELFILRTKMTKAITDILTPEQLGLLKEKKAERMERLSRLSGKGIEKEVE